VRAVEGMSGESGSEKKQSDRRVRDLTHYAGCCVIPPAESTCARVCGRWASTKVGGGGVGRGEVVAGESIRW